MPMTVVVTTGVSMRFRGFLASCMIEFAPGVYCHPRLSRAVRERVWNALQDWWNGAEEASILMLWQDATQPGGLGKEQLGLPPRQLVDFEGFLLSKAEAKGEKPLQGTQTMPF